MALQTSAKPGSRIKKGDVVAEFDRQFMLQRLEDYRSSVAQSEASFKKQQSVVTVTRKNHQQLVDAAKADLAKADLDMRTIPVLGTMDAERAKLARSEAEARYKQVLAEVPFVRTSEESQLKISEMDLQQSKIELRRAEMNADRMVIKAPIDGIVVMQSIFRGGEFGQIQPGDQLMPGQMFMQIVDPSSMVVNATVNQVDVENVRIGSKAMVRFDAYPDLQLPAHVYSIAAITKPGGMRAAFLKEVAVNLKLDAMDPRVIPDLSVSADLILETEPAETPVAPASAIFRDGGPKAQPYVWVKQGDAWVRREVEIGVANEVQVAVRKGLKIGDVVAAEPPKPNTGPGSSGEPQNQQQEKQG
jgi:multidrug efflux pump subunit AcrA (membrane-fusion protein)